MRSAFLVALAATAVAAQNCNPTYNVAGSGECFTGCNIKAGQAYYKDWTMDSTSPHFIPSLQVMCTKGNPVYTAFMTSAGMCMMSCKDDQDLFNKEFAGACAWYAEHKNDVCEETSAEAGASKLQLTGMAAGLVGTAGLLLF
ncbi:hypothetical protein BDB01DRAFT_757532 [Pilobolus umbonatus]|nr:hypothetical protein BDB01DRAFT_757532 [Pilobolus umbonatus]